MDIDRMMKKIAIEEAPKDIVKRWKIELVMREESTQRNWDWLYIVASILFSGVILVLYYFKIKIPWMIGISYLGKFLNAFHNAISLGESIVISSYFYTGSIVFSIIVALLSAVWYYMRYGEIRL